MDVDHNYTLVLYRLLLYHGLGKLMSDFYKQQRAEFLRKKTRNWKCAICKQTIKKRDHTIDHIIPKNLCKQYDLPGLIYDQRNFRLTHRLCNLERGELTIDDMPDNIKALLEKRLQPVTDSSTEVSNG